MQKSILRSPRCSWVDVVHVRFCSFSCLSWFFAPSVSQLFHYDLHHLNCEKVFHNIDIHRNASNELHPPLHPQMYNDRLLLTSIHTSDNVTGRLDHTLVPSVRWEAEYNGNTFMTQVAGNEERMIAQPISRQSG